MVGQMISHYRILEKLGAGGMGMVYKAEDTRLKRTVALKFLPRNLTRDKQARARFVQEAQAASALEHPNICAIYDIDEIQDGRMFICMAYCGGATLRRRIEHGALPIAEVVDIATQIALGLTRAHESGVIHQDIKPENIVTSGRGEVKIVDFGLAKLVAQKTITETGLILGTAAYMSPEQAQSLAVDHRTDIWSLGVILYEMLTSQLPFDGDYDQAVLYSIVNDDPKPLSSVVPNVPIYLGRIVDRALEKSTDARYQNMADLLGDLQLIRHEAETSASKKWGATLASNRLRRGTKLSGKRLKYFVSGTILLIALAVLVLFLQFKHAVDNREPISIAVVDFVNESKEEQLNNLSGMFITALEQSRRLSVMTRSHMFDILKQLGKPDVERIDEKLGKEICERTTVNAMVTATVRKLGEVYSIDLKVRDIEKNEYVFTAREDGKGQETILAMIDKLSKETRKALREKSGEIQMTSPKIADITTRNFEAYQHYFKGQQLLNHLGTCGEAREEFQKAIVLDPTFGLAYYGMAIAHEFGGKAELYAAYSRKALSLINRVPEKERFLVRAHHATSRQLALPGDYKQKRIGFEAGIAVLKDMEKLYPDEKNMLWHLQMWSFLLGLNKQAAEYGEAVLALDPTQARAAWCLTCSYENLGEYRKMRDAAKHWADISVENKGRAWPYRTVATACAQLGEFEPALKMFTQLRGLHPERYYFTVAIADLYAYQGRYGKAEAELNKLVEASQPFEAKAWGYRALAEFYPYLGKYREAIAACEQGITLSSSANHAGWGSYFYSQKSRLLVFGFNDPEAGSILTTKFAADVWQDLPLFAIFRGNYSYADSIATTRETKSHYQSSFIRTILYSQNAECDKAEYYAEDILTSPVGGSWINLELSYYLAQCHNKQGNHNKAIGYLKSLQGIYNNRRFGTRARYYPKSFYLLAKIYEDVGKKNLAVENYRKLLRLWKDGDEDLPDLLDAKVRLAKLQDMTAR